MKKILSLILLALLPMVANADPVEIDGIYYILIPKGKIAEVTSNPYGYTGAVNIPATFTYDGKEFNVTSIGNYAFSGCSDLTSVTIPNSVTSIGTGAFRECKSLTSVTIPNGVTSIGSEAFAYCGSLTSVTIPNSVTSIGDYAFYNCSGLTSVTIPNSVTRIGNYAFRSCSSLTSVTIPNSVTNIGYQAFKNCSGLTSVTIGNGVKSIDYQAFANCPELADVYCYAERVPSTSSSAFYGSYIEYATLYVPESAIEQYRATEPWSLFGTKKTTTGDTPEPPKPEKCATPTISYKNGQLSFESETEGVEFKASIRDTDINDYTASVINLSATYTITVYATKAGYEDSEVATGTLCWIDVAPQTEGIVNEDAVMEVKALPVLIQSQGGTISIQGAVEGTPIAVYDTSGKQYGSTIAEKDYATITTSLRPGSIAVVKIGEKAVKVAIK